MNACSGNFCPVCHKCYSNDDWTTKMIQCSTCDSWVHAKCEGLTGSLLVYLFVIRATMYVQRTVKICLAILRE
jgi:hypothetical protein